MSRFVYFVVNDRSEVKIGTTTDVRRRLSTLQSSTAAQLKCIGVLNGGRALEKQLHEKFQDYRLTNEWFRMIGDMEQWISENTCPFDDVAHSRKSEASSRVEIGICAQMLRDLSGPPMAGDSATKQIERAAQKVSALGFHRVRSIWYRDPRVRIDSAELAIIKSAADDVDKPEDLASELRSALRRIEELERQVRLLKHAVRVGSKHEMAA